MELKITNKEEQKLLDRKLVKARLNFSEKAVPSRKTVLEELSKQLKVDKKLIIIKEIRTVYGSTSADVEVHVYDSEEIKNKLEPKHLIKRSQVTEEKKEKKEEKPSEVKKEVVAEKKEEVKPEAEVKEEKKPAEAKEEAKAEDKKEEPAEKKE